MLRVGDRVKVRDDVTLNEAWADKRHLIVGTIRRINDLGDKAEAVVQLDNGPYGPLVNIDPTSLELTTEGSPTTD